jgi:hypothetical protein
MTKDKRLWWWRSAKEQRSKLSLLASLNLATSPAAPISAGLCFFSLSPRSPLSLTRSRTPKPDLFSYLAFSSLCLVMCVSLCVVVDQCFYTQKTCRSVCLLSVPFECIFVSFCVSAQII